MDIESGGASGGKGKKGVLLVILAIGTSEEVSEVVYKRCKNLYFEVIFLHKARGPKARFQKLCKCCSISLTTVKRGIGFHQEPCVEVVKGMKCFCKVFVGFRGRGFHTILKALPSNKVEDSSSDTPVVFAVDYG